LNPGPLPKTACRPWLFGWLPMGSNRPKVKASPTPFEHGVTDALPLQESCLKILTELRALETCKSIG